MNAIALDKLEKLMLDTKTIAEASHGK